VVAIIIVVDGQCHPIEAEEIKLCEWKALCYHKWLAHVMIIVYVVLL